MRRSFALLACGLIGIATGRAPAQDIFVRQGVPYPLDRDAERVVVRSSVLRGLRADVEAEDVFGARFERFLSTAGDIAILHLDSRLEDVENALARLRSDPDVDFAAPLYHGVHDLAFTIIPEAVVRFRMGLHLDERDAFFAEHGLEPLYEYPQASGRVVCHVTGGQRERDALEAVSRAYFDERVEHVSPGFLQERRFTADCYDPNAQFPSCDFAGPGGIDCPPADPSGCTPPPVCPSCNCTRFPMTLPNGPGDDQFADEFHQFDFHGIWDAWDFTRGNSGTRILIVDTRMDRDHRDVGPQVVLDLEPSNARNDWAKANGSSYAVTLPSQAAAPAYIYFYFVDPPNTVISGASIQFHIDNLRVQESGPSGPLKRNYSFDDIDDPNWQTDFTLPAGSNHTFNRKTVAESGCPGSPGLPIAAPIGTHILRIETTGAGNATTHHIRVVVPGLEAGKAYYVSVDWIPRCGNQPPFEGFVRFGIDGDQACPPRFGSEMGRALEETHGTTVAAIACGADNADGYGLIGVAPDCRVISVRAGSPLIEQSTFGEASSLLAAGRADAGVFSSSVQLGIVDDDYLDAFRQVATRTRNGRGAPFAFSAGNDHQFVFGNWISTTELATSVGALALLTPMSGEPYLTRGCTSSYGADIWVLDHRVFQVNASWSYETYGFTTPDLAGADGFVPGDFCHVDEVQVSQRRVTTSTSWCAPVVAGVYALMVSRDPSLTREEAAQILYHTARRPDAQGRIGGVYLDCALPGVCLGGVDPSPGCVSFPSDPGDPSFVSPAADIPFDPVTSRSRVFGYGVLDANAAVAACDPASPKRWPEPARSLTVMPGKTDPGGALRVRVSWIPFETNRTSRGYDGYILVRSFGAPLSASPLDGTAPPAVGGAVANGVVVAKGEVAMGTLASSFEDADATTGLRHYALFYYRTMGGPQDTYYSFGKTARIVYSPARWKTVTTLAALTADLAAGLDSDDPSKAVVLFVDAATIKLTACLEVGANVCGSLANGRVYIVGDKGLGGVQTRLLVPAGLTGLAICGSRQLSVSGFTISGGGIGLGVWKPGGPTGGCATCGAGAPRADEIEVWNSRFEDNQIGLWLENEGDVLVQNNVIRATGAATHAEAAGLYMPPRPDPISPIDHRTLYSVFNNTIDVAGRPCLRIHMKSLSSFFNRSHRPRLQVFNNILRASGTNGACVEHSAASGFHISNWNDFVVVAPAVCGRIKDGASYATLALWMPIAKSDKSSISADPGFVNIAGGDYHLSSPLSPAVNGGTTEVYEPRFLAFDLDGWSQPRLRSGANAAGAYRARYLGIDIGADELQSATPASDADLGVPFLRGNANNDAEVNVSDPTYLLSFLFSGGPAPACFDAADANDDEQLDTSDAIAILSFLFNPTNVSFSTLPPPHPFCGFDVYRIGSAAAPNQGPYYCGAAACP